MRTYCLISLLLTSLLAQTAPAQSLRRAWQDPIDGVTVMPPYALDSTVTGLLVYNDYPRTKGQAAKPGYVFGWPFLSVDGSLNLYISRRQLYLRTGHNNPNPNMLHWVQDLTPTQFQAIDAALKKPRPPFQAVRNSADFGYFRYLEFEPKTPPNPTLETQAQREAFSAQEERDLAGRVIRLVQQLNRQLPATAPLRVPTDKELFARATYIAESLDELLTGGGVVVSSGKKDAPLKRNFTLAGNAIFAAAGQQHPLDRDYVFGGYTEQKDTRSLTLRWQRKAGARASLPPTLTLQCSQVDKLHVSPAAAGQPPALDQQLWYANLPTDGKEYELVLGLESGRTFHISCAEARLTAAP